MSSSSAFRLRPVLHQTTPGERSRWRCAVASQKQRRTRTLSRPRPVFGGRLCCAAPIAPLRIRPIRANLAESPIAEADRCGDVLYEETFRVERSVAVEGKVSVKLDWEKEGGSKGQLVVGCSLEGKWVLHWGVTYCDDIGSEWDQPPTQMRPPGSVPIKDYAIGTPLKKSSSSSEEQTLHEVKIDLDSSLSVAAIHFVLKVVTCKHA